MRFARALTIAAVLIVGCSRPQAPAPASTTFPTGQVVDLSHAYDDTTIFWPTSDRFRLEKTFDGVTPEGFYYAANNFFTAEHGGTHLDAPLHFAQGAQAVDQIPIERFFGAAVVVDVAAQSERDPDYQITTDDLIAADAAGVPHALEHQQGPASSRGETERQIGGVRVSRSAHDRRVAFEPWF